jgi:hypothetical protein
MCNKEKVNFALCVKNESDCSNPDYEFHYNPETKMIEQNTMSVSRFRIKPDSSLTKDERKSLRKDVLRQQEIGRLKSYVPEFAPTSCFVQKKENVSREYSIGASRLPKKFSNRSIISSPFTCSNCSARSCTSPASATASKTLTST